MAVDYGTVYRDPEQYDMDEILDETRELINDDLDSRIITMNRAKLKFMVDCLTLVQQIAPIVRGENTD